jgi:hypothetical protein
MTAPQALPAADRLLALLPQVFRIRDYEEAVRIAQAQGFPAPDTLSGDAEGPLATLLAAVGRQLDLLEAEVDWLYEDQFIETCADWVVPYIGALVGARIVDVGDAQSARLQVADTIRNRRAKGTARALASRAHDIMVAPAEAIEYAAYVVETWNPNFPGAGRATTAVNGQDGRRLGLATEIGQHVVELRDMSEGGRFAPANVGARVWTTRAAMHAETIPLPVPGGDPGRYHFDPLGRDMALWSFPQDADKDRSRLTAEQIPGPIPLAAAAEDPGRYYETAVGISIDGADQSVDQVCFCDLGDDGPGKWNHHGSPDEKNRIRIDPRRGRFALPGGGAGVDPSAIRAFYHFGSAVRAGGAERKQTTDALDARLRTELGDRDRRTDPVDFSAPEVVPDSTAPSQVDNAFQQALDNFGTNSAVRIEYGATITVPAATTLPANGNFEVRGADGVWPTLRLSAPWQIQGGAGSILTLRGLRLADDALQVMAAGLKQLTLIDCTVVPGSGRIVIDEPACKLIAVRSILGCLRVRPSVEIDLIDCVVDSGAADVPVIAASDGSPAGIFWSERSTLVGDVALLGFDEASNSLFARRPDRTNTGAPVSAQRLQSGCVRYSALPRGSIAPRRYRCFPAEGDTTSPEPVFDSLAYGEPTYATLVPANPDPVLTGAENGGEMGVGNPDSYHRRKRLLDRDLIEWVPFGMATATELMID